MTPTDAIAKLRLNAHDLARQAVADTFYNGVAEMVPHDLVDAALEAVALKPALDCVALLMEHREAHGSAASHLSDDPREDERGVAQAWRIRRDAALNAFENLP